MLDPGCSAPKSPFPDALRPRNPLFSSKEGNPFRMSTEASVMHVGSVSVSFPPHNFKATTAGRLCRISMADGAVLYNKPSFVVDFKPTSCFLKQTFASPGSRSPTKVSNKSLNCCRRCQFKKKRELYLFSFNHHSDGH